MTKPFNLHSSIWNEEPHEDNPFVAKRCRAHGYDVFGEVLPKASWSEYLLLLFSGERPDAKSVLLFEKLAIALANPGPRESSVRAAMNGGVGGSTDASSLIAALAVGAGQYGGAHEVYLLVDAWHRLGMELDSWKEYLQNPNKGLMEDVWSEIEHAPGFDPHGVSCSLPVEQTLSLLAEISSNGPLRWLVEQQPQLEQAIGKPLSMSAVAAAAFSDLGFSAKQAVMLYSILRLPGAAVHALEQEKLGWKKFPAYGNGIELTNDPGASPMPDVSRYGL
ncbi:MAG: citryl-CoA lyase [Pseudomonadales bacterium]|nr:citryl-CoA lyase [Pseudomonadales bacterium]